MEIGDNQRLWLPLPFQMTNGSALLAIDVFTTTGARINELLQINNTKECIQVKTVNAKHHYSFRAIPKGRDEVATEAVQRQKMPIDIVSKILHQRDVSLQKTIANGQPVSLSSLLDVKLIGSYE